MDIQDKFQSAIRESLSDHSIWEIAATLYEAYGDKRPFETFYREVKSKFSKDTRTRFDFCDVILISYHFSNLEPLYVWCELLGLERPKIADTTALLQANIRKVNSLRAQWKEAERQVSLLSQQGPTTPYIAPNLTNVRFSSREQ